ncbi:hypothetical protein Enr10x_60540 [Gimesia panareensis]|uniref:Uncharacterized protein n=1 Tax=Gimesia panareensis TaxID=2527978 RepID=A0A517QGB6_9PLAN|nr:hypothetical protein Enr10x_60540 [Gimesia panareensis]
MSSCISNRAETRGFYSVFGASVLHVPVKKNRGSRARRIIRHSGQTRVWVQSSLFSSRGGYVKWEMFTSAALSGKPTGGTRMVSMREEIKAPHGRIANTRAGKPEPPLGLGKVTTARAPASGT